MLEYVTVRIFISPYFYLIGVLLGLVMGIICRKQGFTRMRSFASGLLAAYMFLVIATTLLSREISDNYHYKFQLFWSWQAIQDGRVAVLGEKIFNVIMFIPIGLLWPFVFRMKFLPSFVLGILFSVSIELLQLIFKCGLFEFDDIVMNSLGMLIGLCVMALCILFRPADKLPPRH